MEQLKRNQETLPLSAGSRPEQKATLAVASVPLETPLVPERRRDRRIPDRQAHRTPCGTLKRRELADHMQRPLGRADDARPSAVHCMSVLLPVNHL